MSRLDRLGSAKMLAQRAAVIGREFDFATMSAFCRVQPDALEVELGKLVDAQLVYQMGMPPQATYSFKHALIQDTAYQSLLKKRRHAMHGELAEVLTSQFPEIASREPEVLAQHFAQAARIEEAIPHYLHAAEHALDRSAQQEAVNQLRSGLDWLQDVSAGPDRDRLELSLLIALQGPLIATSGYANPQVEQVCARALELCNTVGGGPDLPFAVYGLTTFYLNSCNLPACREVVGMLMALSNQADLAQHRVAAHLQLGFVDLFSGNLQDALADLQQSMACYDPEQHESLAVGYGQDPGATAYAPASMAAWHLGYADLAVEYGRRGVALARERDDPFTEAVCLVFLTLTHIGRQEREIALGLAEQTIELCERQNFPQWLHQARVCRGWALADGSETTAEGVAEVQAALGDLAKVSAVIGAPIFLCLLAESLLAAGLSDAALATLDRALTDSGERGNVWMDAELLRLRASILGRSDSPEPDALRELLERGLAKARRTSSRIHEARILCTADRFGLATAENYARLSELSEELTEGSDTADIVEMAAVLANHG